LAIGNGTVATDILIGTKRSKELSTVIACDERKLSCSISVEFLETFLNSGVGIVIFTSCKVDGCRKEAQGENPQKAQPDDLKPIF
jgi:hypothetical protein